MNKSPLNISKKLIIFDINPNNDDITKELIYGKISSAIKKASLRHHVAFLSHSNLFLLKRMVQDIGITNNYIISDAGARIYNSETNKIIFENKIELQTALSISHFGIIKENLLLISSTTHEVVYSPNLVYEDILEKKHYIKLRRIASFTSLVKFLNDNNVFSIMIWNNNFENIKIFYTKLTNIINDWDFEMQKENGSYIIATNKNINKSSSLKHLMNHLQISNIDNVHYFALNVYNKENLTTFKHKYVYQDIVLSSELREKNYDFNFDIDSLTRCILRIY